MTSDDLEWPKRTAAQKTFYGAAHQKNLNEDRPILSAAKRRPNSATVAIVSPFSATVALSCHSVDRA